MSYIAPLDFKVEPYPFFNSNLPATAIESLVCLYRNGCEPQMKQALSGLLTKKDCFWLLIKNYPNEFIPLWIQVESQADRQEIFQAIEEKNPFWIHDSLIPILSSFWQSSPSPDYFQSRFEKLVSAFTPSQLESFVNCCGTTLPLDAIGCLLPCIKNESAMQTFLQSIAALQKEIPFKDGWIQLIKSISPKTTILYPALYSVFFTIVTYLVKNNCFDDLVKHFFELPIESQINFLSVMVPGEQRMILDKLNRDQTALLAQWFGEVLLNEPSLQGRKQLCARFLKRVDNVNFPIFIEALAQQRLKDSLGDLAYAFVPYLLLGLSESQYGLLLCEVDIFTRSQLLAKAPLESFTSEVLDSLQTRPFLSQMLFHIPSNIVDNHCANMELCLIHIQEIVNAKKELDKFPDYEEFITLIPALFIGIVAQQPVERALFFQLARYLTDRQLAFLVRSLPEEDVFAQIEDIASDLRADQLKIIHQSLSSSQLACYAEKKAERIKADWKQCSERLNRLAGSITSLEYSEGIISRKTFDDLFLEASTLFCYMRSTIPAKYHDLIQRLPCQDPIALVLRSHCNKFKASQGVFSESFNLFKRIKVLESRLEQQPMEEDELPIDFLHLLTSGRVIQLGISHAGELNQLGIKNQKDLDCLCISQDRQLDLDRLIITINELAETDGERQIALNQLWEKILALTVSSSGQEFTNLIDQLILLLELKKHSSEQLIRIGNHLYEKLFNLKRLSTSYQDKLRTCYQTIHQSQNVQKTVEDLIRLAVNLIKGRDRLMVLKKYLQQPQLREAWVILHQQGYQKVETLMSSSLIEKNRQLRALFEIASSIGKS